jgi:hypothetical protein
MRILMRPGARSLKMGLASMLLLLVAYASTYLVLVEREPYFDHNLRLISVALSQLDQDGKILPPEKRPPIPPNSYLAKYSIPGRAVTVFFAPVHAFDRLVRPSYWPPIKYRNHC